MLLATLRDQISSNFNLSELKDLCFDLEIEYENLSGDTLNDKSREIIAHCNRRGMLQNLIDRCNDLRPNTEWDVWQQDDYQEIKEETTEKNFSPPIRKQMTELHKTVNALTQDQYEIIKWLRGQRRVAITGCAGSGKTLVAAEKAIRLDDAGIRTLFLCHNPSLAEYLKGLTTGTGVVVFDFSSWINAILEKEVNTGSSWTVYSNYQEPIPQEIEKAREHLVNAKLKYEAIIIDEAQDFREAWWDVIESALVVNGILYAFHDDNQALLPNRTAPFFEESPYNLSKNCRNAGNVFEIVKCFHQQAPEISMFLADKGVVKHSAFEDQKEKDSIRSAVQEALQYFSPHQITILTTEHPPLNQSILNGIEVQEKVSWQWQKEVLKAANTIAGFKRSQLLINGAEELRYSLSNSLYPSESDIQIVNSFFRPYAVGDNHRTRRLKNIKWRLHSDGELELYKHSSTTSYQLLATFFSLPNWVDNLPKIKSYRLKHLNHDFQNSKDSEVINFCDVATFKGLESPAIILFIRSPRDNLSTNLYVGMSRAIFYMHLITNKYLSAQFSQTAWFRRLLDFQVEEESIS